MRAAAARSSRLRSKTVSMPQGGAALELVAPLVDSPLPAVCTRTTLQLLVLLAKVIDGKHRNPASFP